MKLASFRSALAMLGLLPAVLLSSCAHPDAFDALDASVLPAAPAPLVSDGETVRTNGRVTPASGTVARAIIRQNGNGAAVASPRPQNYVAENGDITLNYVEADIREIIRLILGETLKLNYTIDPGLEGNVTIQTVQPVRRDALLATL